MRNRIKNLRRLLLGAAVVAGFSALPGTAQADPTPECNDVGGDAATRSIECPVDRILADDAAAPAALDQLVSGDDRAVRLSEHDEHLQHSRLEGLEALAAGNAPPRRTDEDIAEPKRRHLRKPY